VPSVAYARGSRFNPGGSWGEVRAAQDVLQRD
jgi:hypothetical protein